MSGPTPPRYDGVKFDTLLKPATAAPASGLYQPVRADDAPEPVTEPVALVSPPPTRTSAPVSAVPTPARQTAAPSDSAGNDTDPAGNDTERTLTRRELRAMMQAQQANEQMVTDRPVPSAPAVDAASPAQETSVPVPPESTVSAPVVPIEKVADPTPAPVSAHVPADQPSFADLLSPVTDVPAADHTSGKTSDTSEPKPYQPPTGHWSIAAQEPDGPAIQPEQPVPGYARSRVSSGSVTSSNALILPTVPSIADATGPLTSTGEILVTGSIDLPRSLGATGTHSDRFDSSDIDRLFDQAESEQNTADVAPIRASRAVSTHTSTRDTITPRKHPGNKLPTALAITAAVLALGVVGLLVAAYVFKVF